MSYQHASRSARLAMGAYSISIGLWLLPYQSVQAQHAFSNGIAVPVSDDTTHAAGSAIFPNGIAAEDAPLICFELPDYGAITFTDVVYNTLTIETLNWPDGPIGSDTHFAGYEAPLYLDAHVTVDTYEYQLYRIGHQVAERVSVIFCPGL